MQKLELAIAVIVFVDVSLTLETRKLANYVTKLAKKKKKKKTILVQKYNKIQENIASFVWQMVLIILTAGISLCNTCKVFDDGNLSNSDWS